ncbi:AaceriAGL249Cp [[Ashbya] aceris (nom. inval.)]|nr:AaceriAGL249Cp [[Ashbya] aceris (nom. inval.)]
MGIRLQSSDSMNNQHQTQQNKYFNVSNQASTRSLWSQQQQQQLLDTKGSGSTSKSPMLMANNNVFSIGPYRQRKDAGRVSVLEKYEIIGYIAAGTYGKVYKAKAKEAREEQENSIHIHKQTLGSASVAGIDGGIASREAENGAADPLRLDGHSSIAVAPAAGGGISSGSVHRARSNGAVKTLPKKSAFTPFYAIKKFKTEREGVEQLHYTGISQSACREMSLCRELDNKHLTKLVEIFLERKSIYMVSEFAEHDLLQIIHFHSHPEKRLIPPRMLKSIMWQILDGVSYLHQNWILHRDLKPANIMVTVDGCVKIGDLGLARKFYNLVQTLYTGDKVVVTIWYRAPELLLGARHYSPAIDLWAVGCIFAELIGLRPIFKGEEAKMDSKKSVPFQGNQLQRILEVLGTPTHHTWPNIHKYPEYEQLSKFSKYRDNLSVWYHSSGGRDKAALSLLYSLLKYDPITRIDAIDALEHEYFTNNDPPVSSDVFEGLSYKYPPRRIHTSDNDIMNVGANKNKSGFNHHPPQQQTVNNNGVTNSSIGGLGVNRRILAAAAAAAAAVQVNGTNIVSGSSSSNGPIRKKKR